MSNNLSKSTNKVTVWILGALLSIASICTASTNISKRNYRPKTIFTIEQVSDTTKQDSTVKVKQHSDSLKAELVRQTNEYISSNFPKSKLTGEALVTVCLKHDFDICFALAQAEIESGFGTAGKAKRTNSPWNVGAWDGRSVQSMNKLGYGYSHPDQSIEPYIELVKTKYLGTKRSIDDLMNHYVSLSGHRYASAPNYERTLKKTYKNICMKTTLRDLQTALQKAI